METNYWIFIVTDHKKEDINLTVENIFHKRMNDRFWGLGESTPNRSKLKKGDKVVFYLGNPIKAFGGNVVLKNDSYELNQNEKQKYSHESTFYDTDYGVNLEEINIWENKIQVENIVSDLSFIQNKSYWYTYFQGGVRGISEEDYNTIISNRTKNFSEEVNEVSDLEDEYKFALEMHLEEFMYRNWGSINWNSKLKLYQTEEQDGRQFPADQWSIDFLAIDKNTNDLVVIELKRGKTSDSVVGQILRYISWVKENIAEKNQNVKGIIIGNDSNDEMDYALNCLDYIDFKKYKIDFKLE